MAHPGIRGEVWQLQPYGHGAAPPADAIRLHANENPLGPSPFAVEAIVKAAADSNRYPDAGCSKLRSALAKMHEIDENCIVVGNGSDELIHLLGLLFLQPGVSAIAADPSFVRYYAAPPLAGATLHRAPLDADLKHDLDSMAECFDHTTRLVFVANPNNPTGTLVGADDLETLLDRLPDPALLVLDEAYFEYVGAPYSRGLDWVREGRNAMVLRTFSKAYGLAGLRIGVGFARPDIIDAINRAREPFNVGSIAQAAALAALQDQEHLAKTRTLNDEGLRTFHAFCAAYGLRYTDSHANFAFIDLGKDARPIAQAIAHKGVLVRAGLGLDNWIRVNTGLPEQNQAFLDALKEHLE